MSRSRLIDYVQKLLFGSSDVETPPPPSFFPIQLELQSKQISVENTILNGGLTKTPHMIAGDLDTVLRRVEKASDDDPSPLSTTLVKSFYNHLSVLLSRHYRPKSKDPSPPLPVCDRNDSSILSAILRGDATTVAFEYSCPRFWGDLARRLLQNRRPVPQLVPLDASAPPGYPSRAIRLYDVTCKMRGEFPDPLSMHLVSDEDHVDSVHWRDAGNLEARIRSDPEHPLCRAVVRLVRDAIRSLLDGRRPEWIGPEDSVDQFLENVNAVQIAVDPVHQGPFPPRVVDAFQRLLAFGRLDSLWRTGETTTTVDRVTTGDPISALALTEKVLLLEKLNALLLQKHRGQ